MGKSKEELIESLVNLIYTMSLKELRELRDVIKKLISIKKESSVKQTSNSAASKQTKEKKSKNLFETMPEFDSFKEDSIIDKKLFSGRVPLSNDRKPQQKVECQCIKCGKKEKVSPKLIYDITRYRCNSCSRGPL